MPNMKQLMISVPPQMLDNCKSDLMWIVDDEEMFALSLARAR